MCLVHQTSWCIKCFGACECTPYLDLFDFSHFLDFLGWLEMELALLCTLWCGVLGACSWEVPTILDLDGEPHWFFCPTALMPFLSVFILLHLLGLVARFGTALHFWHFVVFGMLFLALLLGLPTVWDVSLHLLSIGCHKLQAFPAGKYYSSNARSWCDSGTSDCFWPHMHK